jgi:hypothetical protein
MDDLELHPPDVEPARPWMPCDANGAPSSVRIVSREGPPLETAPAAHSWRLRLRRPQTLAKQATSAEGVRDRERVAVAGVPRLEVALEAGGPHLIRTLRRQHDRPRRVPPPAPLRRRSRSLRPRLSLTGAERRPLELRVTLGEDQADLPGSRAVPPTCLEDQRLHASWRPMRAASRRSLSATRSSPSSRKRFSHGYPVDRLTPQRSPELGHRPRAALTIMNESQPRLDRLRSIQGVSAV